jgi:hypothetical protein
MATDGSGVTDAVQATLQALRRRGDEAQLTQILARFAAGDPRFAAELVRTWLAVAPRTTAVSALGAVPDELACEAEHHAFDDRGTDRGFVDLRFSDENEAFVLFVELKLHSGYGERQLERYGAALQALKGKSALLALTTWLPQYGEEAVAEDPRWLGSARWAHAFDGMRKLEHRDPTLRVLWPELLDLMRHQGDFGIMDIDEEAIEGWARWKTGRSQLTALLEEIHVPTLRLLQHDLAPRLPDLAPVALAADIRHKDKRLVWPWGESLHIEYAIPAASGERFRIQFLGGRERLLFTVEARHSDNHVLNGAPDALRAASDRLRADGFETGHYWGAYWSRAHPTEEWIGSAQPADALFAIVQNDTKVLIESGIFEALREAPDIGPTPVPPETDVPDL